MDSLMQANTPILLVDDSIVMRQTIRNMLNDIGYTNIQTASNGMEAMVKVRSGNGAGRPYEIIFLDWNMPEMDGITFLKACRAMPEMDNVAIVMLTAVSDQMSVVEAMNNGVTSYITKPVSRDMINKKIQQVEIWLQGRRRGV